MKKTKILSFLILILILGLSFNALSSAAIVVASKFINGPATVGSGTIVSGTADSTKVDDGTYFAIDELKLS
jgi:hypothetical protein